MKSNIKFSDLFFFYQYIANGRGIVESRDKIKHKTLRAKFGGIPPALFNFNYRAGNRKCRKPDRLLGFIRQTFRKVLLSRP